jgi:ubiquinone/menaquinone biosynthesis C-methylase UbiE
LGYVAARFAGLRNSTETPQRAEYARVWDAMATSEHDAKMSVVGFADEGLIRSTGEVTADRIRATVGVRATDTVLEIGAGVGRIGAALAPLCREWIGTDVSESMLRHMRARLSDHANARFVRVNGYDLAPIESASIDLVYCVVVFMHLDEWDRYNYVLESARVLRPGGRIFVDNFNLCGDKGWELFDGLRADCRPLERPPQISKSSTRDELREYLVRAGFVDVATEEYDELWIAAHGHKPDTPEGA